MCFFHGEKLFRLIFLFENFIQSLLCEIGFLSADLAAQGGGELPELGFRQTDNHGAAEVRSQLGRCRKGRQRGYGGQLPLFVGQKIAAAKWFIEALRQRQNTLESTMRAIIEYQHDYFIDGDESSLKPMVLKDIAERTGFDISTISRVVNSKWIETHFGVFPLKYFFSEGLENSEGEEVSTREIKKVLRDLVDNEDKHNPLTDDDLVDALTEKGYKVARRTIAKYRAQLDIPKARLRREL